MWKTGSINVLLMTLLFGSGNFLRMERGFAVGRTDVTKSCDMPEACNVDGFTDWFKVGQYCVKYFNTSANFTDAENALKLNDETVILTFNRLGSIEVHYMEKNPGMFSSKTLISFRRRKDMNILDDMGFSCEKTVPGGHLVSVHNEKDNKLLFCTVQNLNPNDLRIWLGGYQLFKSGKYRWIDNSYWNFQSWVSGQPSHLYANEECVEMNWKEDKKWNDDSCSVKKKYFCAFK